MKTAATVLIIIGAIANFFLTYDFIAMIGVVFGLIALATLAFNKKVIAIGVLTIIFCGALGGIFYLCWRPDDF